MTCLACAACDHTITYTLTANGGGAGGVAELFGQK
jgi:hypothetical protein